MYQFDNIRPGAGGGAATLAFDTPPRPRSFGSRTAALPRRDFDLVVDLGSRIGSRTWFRGVATCTALCGAALWLAPGFDPIPAASAKPLSDAQFNEARVLAISPLALGAGTGRRMAPTDAVRPVPLTFSWALTPLDETVAELVTTRQVPAYVVHPTQAGAVDHATSLVPSPR